MPMHAHTHTHTHSQTCTRTHKHMPFHDCTKIVTHDSRQVCKRGMRVAHACIQPAFRASMSIFNRRFRSLVPCGKQDWCDLPSPDWVSQLTKKTYFRVCQNVVSHLPNPAWVSRASGNLPRTRATCIVSRKLDQISDHVLPKHRGHVKEIVR